MRIKKLHFQNRIIKYLFSGLNLTIRTMPGIVKYFDKFATKNKKYLYDADYCIERLKSKSIIDDRFDYYSDFRWGTSVIKQINEKIMNRHLHADTDIKALLQIIQLADKNQSGLTRAAVALIIK